MKSPKPALSPRPGKIVRDYLEREFLAEGQTGSRIPTIDQIAQHLDASTSTVRYVIRKLIEEGKLEATQGKGTFLRQQSATSPLTAPLTLGCNIMRYNAHGAASLNWSETIYFGAIRQASTMDRPISMLPIRERDPRDLDGRHHDLLKWIEHIDLLMLYPLRVNEEPNYDQLKRTEEVVHAYESAGKPVVWINPLKLNLPYNFVSCDYYEIAYQIGKAWRSTGRRKILFIASVAMSNSISDQLYLNGLANGARCYDDPDIELRVEVASMRDPESGRLVIERIASTFMPDAILCSSDMVAPGVMEALQERGIRIPVDVSLVAGTGLYSTLTHHPELTHVQQPMERIGAEAVRMLVQRAQSNNRIMPGVYLPATLYLGSTIRAEEKELLHALSTKA